MPTQLVSLGPKFWTEKFQYNLRSRKKCFLEFHKLSFVMLKNRTVQLILNVAKAFLYLKNPFFENDSIRLFYSYHATSLYAILWHGIYAMQWQAEIKYLHTFQKGSYEFSMILYIGTLHSKCCLKRVESMLTCYVKRMLFCQLFARKAYCVYFCCANSIRNDLNFSTSAFNVSCYSKKKFSVLHIMILSIV